LAARDIDDASAEKDALATRGRKPFTDEIDQLHLSLKPAARMTASVQPSREEASSSSARCRGGGYRGRLGEQGICASFEQKLRSGCRQLQAASGTYAAIPCLSRNRESREAKQGMNTKLAANSSFKNLGIQRIMTEWQLLSLHSLCPRLQSARRQALKIKS